MFILDASGSVTQPNFDMSKEFIVDLVSELNIGADAVQVGLIRYEWVVSDLISLKVQ